jgi:hypothetical protein
MSAVKPQLNESSKEGLSDPNRSVQARVGTIRASHLGTIMIKSDEIHLNIFCHASSSRSSSRRLGRILYETQRAPAKSWVSQARPNLRHERAIRSTRPFDSGAACGFNAVAAETVAKPHRSGQLRSRMQTRTAYSPSQIQPSLYRGCPLADR